MEERKFSEVGNFSYVNKQMAFLKSKFDLKKKSRTRPIPILSTKSSVFDAPGSVKLEQILCRICLDASKKEVPIKACRCKGSVGFVHLSCLEHWLEVSNTRSCELCSFHYSTIRRPRYSCAYSIIHWMFVDKDPNFHRGLKSDLIVFCTLTPMAMLGIYGCIIAADYYSVQTRRNLPVAKWTTVSLLIMIILLTFAYYLWLVATVKFHGRVWYGWWQSTNIVHVKPCAPLDGDDHDVEVPTTSNTLGFAVPGEGNNSNSANVTELSDVEDPEVRLVVNSLLDGCPDDSAANERRKYRAPK